MKYDLAQQLKDHRNNPITNGDEPVTLGSALEQACINGQPERADSDAKLRQFKLAQKLATRDNELRPDVEFSSEDVTFLKTLASSILSAIAYGSIVEALENPIRAEREIPLDALQEAMGDKS